jgi:hypothetical protein
MPFFRQFFLKIFITAVFLMGLLKVSAQGSITVENLKRYEFERLHFGFSLGINSSNFIISPARLKDSVMIVQSAPQYGFNLGIIAEYAVLRYVTVRFVPDLAFAERNLDYTIDTYQGPAVFTKSIESTFLDFPLDLKLRSARLKNFAAYVLAGGKYTIDLASQKNVDNTNLAPDQQVVKLSRNDIGYEMGAGVEFYLPYFKFAIEGKLSMGFKPLLIKDNTIFSNSIDQLYSKMFLISFTFEG